MITPLPEKICITGRNVDPGNFKDPDSVTPTHGLEMSPEDLTPEARVKYDAYYAEKARRKDPSQPGVAQEALDCLEYLRANKLSTDLLHKYGYSHRSTVKPALREEARIIAELKCKPSKDVEENPAIALKVADVKAKNKIDEYKLPKAKEVE